MCDLITVSSGNCETYQRIKGAPAAASSASELRRLAAVLLRCAGDRVKLDDSDDGRIAKAHDKSVLVWLIRLRHELRTRCP